MKVALVLPGGVDRTGTERVIPILLALMERLARAHEVHVFALQQEPAPCRYSLAGATIHCTGWGRGASLRALGAVQQEHGRGRFDLVHAVFGGVAPAAALSARRCGVPLLVHLAGGELTDLPGIAYGGWRGPVRRWVLRTALARAARITVPSAPMAERARSLGIPSEVLTYGIDLGHWTAVAPRPRDPAAPARLLFVGSLNRVKDPETLLATAAALRDGGVDFRLRIVGTDVRGGEVHRLAARLGLEDRVTFDDFLTQRELRPVMREADLLLVTSRHEAGPVVAMEAAMCGVPVAGSAVGHLREWAPDGAATVPPGDPAALAHAVRALLADDERRMAMARAAQERARAVDADHAAARVLQLYREMTLGR